MRFYIFNCSLPFIETSNTFKRNEEIKKVLKKLEYYPTQLKNRGYVIVSQHQSYIRTINCSSIYP